MAQIPLSDHRNLVVISAYTPTMTNDDVTKEAFYDGLDRLIADIPRTDILVLLGDMNTRVGSDHIAWSDQIAKHGIGKCNSNGHLLL